MSYGSHCKTVRMFIFLSVQSPLYVSPRDEEPSSDVTMPDPKAKGVYYVDHVRLLPRRTGFASVLEVCGGQRAFRLCRRYRTMKIYTPQRMRIERSVIPCVVSRQIGDLEGNDVLSMSAKVVLIKSICVINPDWRE